jgi:diacylglycerol kinase family enzyme
MRKIHIINPAAGIAKAHLFIPKGIEVYETKGPHDLERFIEETCKAEPDIHITVYGGDGTVSEAVNGIMAAGSEAMEKTVLSVVPKGSGNDFVRNFAKGEKFLGKVDVIKCNDRYCINSINIGFDCDVIVETDKVKKNVFTSGSLGYIVGVVKVLSKELGTQLEISITDKNGRVRNFNGEFLLTALGNGKYCGGGFNFAPAASLDDGLFDVLVVNKMSKSTFVKLVGDYRSGKHVDLESCKVGPKYKHLLKYYQCREMTVKNISRVGIDGEIFETDKAEISIIPSAINVQMPSLDLTKFKNTKQ